MKAYDHSDFGKNEAWICFRVDTQIQSDPADIYVIMDGHSGFLFGHEIAVDEDLSAEQAEALLKSAHQKVKTWPKRLLIVKDDPAIPALEDALEAKNIALELTTAGQLTKLIAPMKREFGRFAFSPSSMAHSHLKDELHEDDQEAAKAFVPDAYDLCSCASGKKYKFCCKKVFKEIVMAMAAGEEGRKKEAMDWIAKAKSVVGETAEVLCREAIVYMNFDEVKAQEVLQRSLTVNPDHPRANYVDGLSRKIRGDLTGAVESYRRAIDNYPTTDRYHLNETYNNLGTTLHELRDFEGAKRAWEQALIFLPSDRVVRRNLAEFIYENPELPPKLREISPFVQKFFRPTN